MCDNLKHEEYEYCVISPKSNNYISGTFINTEENLKIELLRHGFKRGQKIKVWTGRKITIREIAERSIDTEHIFERLVDYFNEFIESPEDHLDEILSDEMDQELEIELITAFQRWAKKNKFKPKVYDFVDESEIEI